MPNGLAATKMNNDPKNAAQEVLSLPPWCRQLEDLYGSIQTYDSSLSNTTTIRLTSGCLSSHDIEGLAYASDIPAIRN
jgi:hypothetical protein